MEDLDRERIVPGCAAQMLRTLGSLGLTWDGEVEFQSRRTPHYEEALARLRARGLTFECSCSRRELVQEGGYPGTCRVGPRRSGPTATRFRVPDREVTIADRLQGPVTFDLAARGDVIVRRRDQAFAYQLAVVVDDHLQGVTDVVRGADLLDSTPWQIALQDALRYPPPRYAHLPLVTEPDGRKLAKSRRSVALDPARPAAQLWQALDLLGQQPTAELKSASPREVLAWGLAGWETGRIAGRPQVRLRLR